MADLNNLPDLTGTIRRLADEAQTVEAVLNISQKKLKAEREQNASLLDDLRRKERRFREFEQDRQALNVAKIEVRGLNLSVQRKDGQIKQLEIERRNWNLSKEAAKVPQRGDGTRDIWMKELKEKDEQLERANDKIEMFRQKAQRQRNAMCDAASTIADRSDPTIDYLTRQAVGGFVRFRDRTQERKGQFAVPPATTDATKKKPLPLGIPVQPIILRDHAWAPTPICTEERTEGSLEEAASTIIAPVVDKDQAADEPKAVKESKTIPIDRKRSISSTSPVASSRDSDPWREVERKKRRIDDGDVLSACRRKSICVRCWETSGLCDFYGQCRSCKINKVKCVRKLCEVTDCKNPKCPCLHPGQWDETDPDLVVERGALPSRRQSCPRRRPPGDSYRPGRE